ncbi:hypothetical protein NC652_039747 [Populus alba x Populus x berolinensis]|nr:hypothetical protein NC652_039747 [Populus alba x Populus x berolinensis]
MSGTKRTSLLNWIASAFVIAFIIVVGFIHFRAQIQHPIFRMGQRVPSFLPLLCIGLTLGLIWLQPWLKRPGTRQEMYQLAWLVQCL